MTKITLEQHEDENGYRLSYGLGNRTVDARHEEFDGFYVLYIMHSGSSRRVFGVAKTFQEADKRLHDILMKEFDHGVYVTGTAKPDDLEDRTKHASSSCHQNQA